MSLLTLGIPHRVKGNEVFLYGHELVRDQTLIGFAVIGLCLDVDNLCTGV